MALTFAPGATGIGGNANSPNLTYTIISDAVPEPTTLTLLALGAFGLLFARRGFAG